MIRKMAITDEESTVMPLKQTDEDDKGSFLDESHGWTASVDES